MVDNNKRRHTFTIHKYFSPEHRKHLSEAQKGKKMPKEQKEKISKSRTGVKHTEEAKRKISLSMKGKSINIREKNGNWKGGLSFLPYSTDWTETLRRSIRERDKYTCQICKTQQGDKTFAVHHIDYNKLNCNPDNLITLCHRCHLKTNMNRNNWENYFKNQIR